MKSIKKEKKKEKILTNKIQKNSSYRHVQSCQNPNATTFVIYCAYVMLIAFNFLTCLLPFPTPIMKCR